MQELAQKTAQRLAIIAGSGELPNNIAHYCQQHDIDAIIVSFSDHKRDDIDGFAHFVVRIDKFAPILDLFKRENITDLVMAGAIRRPSLWELRPDAMALRVAADLIKRGDNELLHGIAQFMETEAGVHVAQVGDYLPMCELPIGKLGAHSLDEEAHTDIARAQAILESLSDGDIGQAIAVQQGLILAIEAIEGTDAMIARAGELKRGGLGPVLVKLPKTNQDMRVDLPTIGVDTIKKCHAAGFRGVCIATHNMIIVDQPAVINAADACGMFVWAIKQ